MSNQLHHSRLDSAGYDKIFVRNLSLLALVGVLPHERFAPRPVFVNLSFVCDVSQAAASAAEEEVPGNEKFEDKKHFYNTADLSCGHTIGYLCF